MTVHLLSLFLVSVQCSEESFCYSQGMVSGLHRSTRGCCLWWNQFGTGHNFWEKQCYWFHIFSCLVCPGLSFCCSLQACKQSLMLLEVLGSSIANTNFLVAQITLVTAIVIWFGVRWRLSYRCRQIILWGHWGWELLWSHLLAHTGDQNTPYLPVSIPKDKSMYFF